MSEVTKTFIIATVIDLLIVFPFNHFYPLTGLETALSLTIVYLVAGFYVSIRMGGQSK